MLEATKLARGCLSTEDTSTLVTSEGQFLKPGVAPCVWIRSSERYVPSPDWAHPHPDLLMSSSRSPFLSAIRSKKSPNADELAKLAKLKSTLPITGRDKSRCPQSSKRAIFVFHNGNLLTGQSCTRDHKPQGEMEPLLVHIACFSYMGRRSANAPFLGGKSYLPHLVSGSDRLGCHR